jgi:hypothetical protein
MKTLLASANILGYFIDLTSKILTIIVASITIYLFSTKRKKISVYTKYLMNYIINTLFHTTIHHLDTNINEAKELINKEIHDKAILKVHEITGALEGDTFFKKKLEDRIVKINKLLSSIATKTDFNKFKGNLIQLLSSLQQELKTIESQKIQDEFNKLQEEKV